MCSKRDENRGGDVQTTRLLTEGVLAETGILNFIIEVDEEGKPIRVSFDFPTGEKDGFWPVEGPLHLIQPKGSSPKGGHH